MKSPFKYYPELYLGYTLRDDHAGKFKLGFATPYTTDKAGEKRISTVDDWVKREAGGNWVKKNLLLPDNYKNQVFVPNLYSYPSVVRNIPKSGFSFTKMVRRYSTSNVVWRVIDPDDIHFEISSSNLAYIMEDCGIQKGGIIPGKCVWLRTGAQNFLVPEGTEHYEELKGKFINE